ncbi:YihY/virulence factor BrkB family protein [Pseudobacteriovorax antillogorgiicola]|uniref:Membrane protein n=1 Tax=Pseudobacteriovorax antillogorgiicola TaxID=1513793 RepID=A0A1Y6B3M8_9BACT|nr:YihY family inner membrane protein [Pseudobacteriovorax antillogorgiicola]TCS59436.1 membrane protein [Pseudobacteriovorax antillogorgiicola]SME88293.1 membrane protein [Pseudobacteriovorax antillogorgiicola]
MREQFNDFSHRAMAVGHSFYKDMIRHDILRHAYAMSYVSLLSLIPSLAAIFAVLSLFNPLLSQDSNFIHYLKDFVLEHLATASGQQAIDHIEGFIANLDLKKIGISGLAGTMVTLILLLKHIEVALNTIFQVHKPRNLITRFVNFWTFLTLGSFSLAIFVGTLSSYASDGALSEARSYFSIFANKFIMVILFSLIYKLVPNCYVSTLWAFLGGLLATAALNLASSIIQSYIVLFTNYEAIYGAALAALPIFLLWLYIIWIIILLGALFTWRMQNRRQLAQEQDQSTMVPESPYSEAKAKTKLPEQILDSCYKKFDEGKGEGLTKSELASELCVPLYWIEEFVDLLADRSLIIVDRSTGQEPSIHPKRPKDSLDEVALDELLSDRPQ